MLEFFVPFLTSLSEFAIHSLFIAGVVCLVAGVILTIVPLGKPYAVVTQIAGAVVFAAGMFAEGWLHDHRSQAERMKELEGKIELQAAQISAASASANVGVQTRVIEKTKVVHDKGDTIIKYVNRVVLQDKEIIKYVENCPVPKQLIDAHNAAATGKAIAVDIGALK